MNALKVLIPDLEPSTDTLPRGAENLQNGYVLLRARDEYNQAIHGHDGDAIRDYLEEITGEVSPPDSVPTLQRWARLRLPNGQIARSAWKEKRLALRNVRMARNVRYTDDDGAESYAEVQFFFQAEAEPEDVSTLALVHPYPPPDQDLLNDSSHTLWVCDGADEDLPQVIDVSSITSVVGMVPFDDRRFFAAHKMGLEVGSMAGEEDHDPEN
ncbi:hypothetical protein C8J57DRAFT_1084365 [Mycena rebaudengoi]|nr:hypothetical protein C8J57DRAFT_1084365 [Mycena rebaudengoi]